MPPKQPKRGAVVVVVNQQFKPVERLALQQEWRVAVHLSACVPSARKRSLKRAKHSSAYVVGVLSLMHESL